MAKTLLQIVIEVARQLRLDTNITAFSDDDETQLLVDYINEGNRNLRNSVKNLTYLDKRGTITTASGTRLYSVASDATALEVFEWSYYDDTNNNPLERTTTQIIQSKYPDDYLDKLGKPEYIYIEAGQIGFYPVPDGTYEIDYIYKKELTDLTSTTATFDYPDDWLEYLKFYAIYKYQAFKGLGDAPTNQLEAESRLQQIRAWDMMANPSYFY